MTTKTLLTAAFVGNMDRPLLIKSTPLSWLCGLSLALMSLRNDVMLALGAKYPPPAAFLSRSS